MGIRKLLIGAVLMASLTTAGCGSSPAAKPTTPKPQALSAIEWVAKFCATGKVWNDKIGAALSGLQNTTPATLEEEKQVLVSFLDTAIVAFDQIDAEAAKLGTPEVAGGPAAIATLHGEFSTGKAALDKAKSEAEALPTDDVTAFSQGADAIGNELNDVQFGDNGHLTFGQRDLDAGYAANADCQSMENGGTPSP